MSDGYIVQVTTAPMDGGAAVKEIWYAHIHDGKRAIRAVRKAAGAAKDVAIDIVRAEKHSVLLERLGVLEGEVRPSEAARPNARASINPRLKWRGVSR